MCQGKARRRAGTGLAVSLDMAVARPGWRRAAGVRRPAAGSATSAAARTRRPGPSAAGAWSSGVCVPLITLAETTHISFHRLGVPRLMIW